jgi:hypothetical protein
MKVPVLQDIGKDFGRSNFASSGLEIGSTHNKLIAALIGLFVVLAFGADLLWPVKKVYFAFNDFGFQAFTRLDQLSVSMRYCHGGSGIELTMLGGVVTDRAPPISESSAEP